MMENKMKFLKNIFWLLIFMNAAVVYGPLPARIKLNCNKNKYNIEAFLRTSEGSQLPDNIKNELGWIADEKPLPYNCYKDHTGADAVTYLPKIAHQIFTRIQQLTRKEFELTKERYNGVNIAADGYQETRAILYGSRTIEEHYDKKPVTHDVATAANRDGKTLLAHQEKSLALIADLKRNLDANRRVLSKTPPAAPVLPPTKEVLEKRTKDARAKMLKLLRTKPGRNLPDDVREALLANVENSWVPNTAHYVAGKRRPPPLHTLINVANSIGRLPRDDFHEHLNTLAQAHRILKEKYGSIILARKANPRIKTFLAAETISGYRQKVRTKAQPTQVPRARYAARL
jgi:hypothetical protein